MPTLLRYCRRLLRLRRFERDLDDELRATVDLLAEEKQRAGMAPAAARRAARLELGNPQSLKEDVRDAVGVRLLQDVGRDCRVAVRTLRREPLVTGVAILSLALAIGANTAIFSIVNGLMLRTLPVRDPAGLVLLTDARLAPRVRVWDYAVWQQIRQRPELFDGAAAWSFTRFDLASGGESQFVEGMWASGTFFDVLGVDAHLGRRFSERDDQRGGGPDGPVAVISYASWQDRFGGAADIVGRVVRLNTVPFTIIGVMPPGFFGAEVGRSFDVVVPLHSEPLVRGRDAAIDNPGSNFLTVIARLRPEQSREDAVAALHSVQPLIRDATMPTGDGLPPGFVDRYLRDALLAVPADTGFSTLRLQYARPILVITVVVGLVLLIACVNIANLLLARGIARRPEMKLRLAIGASRWRVARQLLTESLMMAAAGTVLGVVMAPYVSRFLVAQLTTPTNVVFLDTSLDGRVLMFSVAIAGLTALLFGTAPAFSAARVSLMQALAERGHQGHQPLRGGPAGWLVVAQVALTMVLVVAAGLFVRSFASLANQPLGLDADRVLVVTIDPERSAIDVAERRGLYERVQEAVLRIPAVEDATISLRTPVTTGGFTPPLAIDDGPALQAELFGNLISSRFFDTYGMRLLAGRGVTEQDRSGAPPVAIVNQTFARRYFAMASPLGRTIVAWPGSTRAIRMTVIGVVSDAVYFSAREPMPPSWYMPIAQMNVPEFPFSPVRLSVRSRAGLPSRLTRDVEAAIASVDPQLALTFRPLAEQVRASLTRERIMAQLAGFFGALALLLAGVGLYGVTAYAISRRRTEIGIRLALGAAPGSIVRAVVGRVSALVAAGVVIGVVGAAWAARFVSGLIYGLQPRDAGTLAGAVAVICATAALAGWLPARRAVRLNPAVVLRDS